MIYLALKAAHIISVIAWMAGLFYLPRLLVYHAEAGAGSAIGETFKIMERRLLKAIMTPGMVASSVIGISLVLVLGAGALEREIWFVIKVVLVVLMTIYHFWLAGFVRSFSKDSITRTSKFFRLINEIPTLLMIVIVVLVVVRPF